MRVARLAVAIGPFLLGVAGCRPSDACAPPAGGACGGDPVGRWSLIDPVCQDPAFSADLAAIAKRTYRGQPIVTAGMAPPEPTSSDWCADLKYGADGIESLNLPRPTPRLLGADLDYGSDGTYSALVTTSDTTSIDFSAGCISRFGYPATCAEFAVAFAKFGTVLGGVRDTSCADDGNGGCTCKYTIESDAAGTKLQGLWSAAGTILTHHRADMALPSQADFCVSGDRMTLWGHDKTSVLDLGGVRMMTLQRIACGNGVIDRGEDCDPPDGTTCDPQCHALAPPPEASDASAAD